MFHHRDRTNEPIDLWPIEQIATGADLIGLSPRRALATEDADQALGKISPAGRMTCPTCRTWASRDHLASPEHTDLVARHDALRQTLAGIAALDPSRTGHTGPDTPAITARYARRNALIHTAIGQALRCGLPAGIGTDPADTARPVVAYIELPTGQVSWHLPAHDRPFDGHSTTDKYARVARYTR